MPQKHAQDMPTGADREKCQELMTFLRNIGLLHCADLLLRNGFDDLETLVEMTGADMKDMGIPAHDAARLRKSLQHFFGPASEVDEGNPVAVFLQESGLEQYVGVLVRNGFDDMETLLEIQDSDMRDLGLPRGHALKLAKRLREFQTSSPAAGQAHQPPVPPTMTYQGAAGTPVRPGKCSLQGLPATEAQSSAVQRSWERVQHLGSYALGEKLYKHVFKVAPQTMELFPPEVRHKYRDWSAEEGGEEEGDLLDSPALRKLFGKVLNAVGVSVAGLRQPSQMVPMLTQLGARHIGYSVEESYWKVLGEGLILTLKECLGEDFTPEVELAWTLVYGFMSAVMIEGLRGAIAARSAARHPDDRSSLHSGHSVRLGSASEEPLQHRMWSNSQAFTQSDTEDLVAKTPSIGMRSVTQSDIDDLGAKTPSIAGSLVEGDAPH